MKCLFFLWLCQRICSLSLKSTTSVEGLHVDFWVNVFCHMVCLLTMWIHMLIYSELCHWIVPSFIFSIQVLGLFLWQNQLRILCFSFALYVELCIFCLWNVFNSFLLFIQFGCSYSFHPLYPLPIVYALRFVSSFSFFW